MIDTFVPGLYNTTWYNGLPFNYDEGFISNRENFLVGMPRLRQVRIRQGKRIKLLDQYFKSWMIVAREHSTPFQFTGCSAVDHSVISSQIRKPSARVLDLEHGVSFSKEIRI